VKKVGNKSEPVLPPVVLVHACCAPCATVAVQRLAGRCRLVFFFYGPNIHPAAEYRRRLEEMQKMCSHYRLQLIAGAYRPALWGRAIAPWRHLPEGSERCRACYRLRMEETARLARQEGIAAFTVTLSVSRHKNSRVLAEIGREVAAAAGLEYLDIDFKKQDGFGQSVRLSAELGLYRQDYCGCALSLSEALRRRARRSAG
jgi:ribonuclease HII